MNTPEAAGNNLEVGKFYLVDCAVVWSKLRQKEIELPVIGPPHVDKAFFDHKHYHIDGRFISKRLEGVIQHFEDGLTANIVYIGDDPFDLKFIRTTQKKLKCIRVKTGTQPPQNIMKMSGRFVTWAKSMMGKSCAGKKCPHYGTTMIEHDGRLVCPLHNLMSDEKQEVIESVCTYH